MSIDPSSMSEEDIREHLKGLRASLEDQEMPAPQNEELEQIDTEIRILEGIKEYSEGQSARSK